MILFFFVVGIALVGLGLAGTWQDFRDGYLPPEYEDDGDVVDSGIDELKNGSVMDTHYHS
jgi:hypothetical protein